MQPHYDASGPRTDELVARYDAVLARILQEQVPDKPRLWLGPDERLLLSEQLDLTVARTWLLNSERYGELVLESAIMPGDIELVPIPDDQFVTADIDTTFAERRCAVLRNGSLPTPSRLLDQSPSGFAAIPMWKYEYRNSPRVHVSTTVPSGKPSSLWSPRGFLPVSHVKFESLPGSALMSTLSVHAPDSFSIDFAALECVIDWRPTLADLEDALGRVPVGQESAREIKRLLLLSHTGQVKDWLVLLKAAVDEGRTEAGLARRIRPKTWRGEITTKIRELQALRRRLIRDRGRTTDIEERVTAMRRALSNDTRFAYPVRLCENGLGELHPLQSTLQPYSDQVLVTARFVAYTAERHPDTFGRRSGIALIAIAAVMLASAALLSGRGVLAVIDLPLLPSEITVPAPVRDSESALNDIRDALTAVILLFPAVLLGQFLLSRPKSLALSSAQLGTFILVSFVFSLPVIPATLLAGGAVASDVIVALRLVALSAFIAGTLLVLTLSKASLSLLRSSEIAAALRKSRRLRSTRNDEGER